MPSGSADVVVIGAGIIGGSIAWRLAQRGIRVLLLDAGVMGAEASWAGAGMLAPGGEMEQAGAWSDFALDNLRQYRGFVEELEAESGVEIDFRQDGAVDVAFDEQEWENLKRRAERQREIDIRSTELDAAQLRSLLPEIELRLAGALLYPEEAIVNPRDVTRALKTACGDRKVQIREGCRAVDIHAGRDSVEVNTSQGSVSVAAAVVAAGAWSGQIPVWLHGVPYNLPASFPVRGHLLGYTLPSGSLRPIVRHGPSYVLQRSNGFTIAGTSSEHAGFDRRIDPQIVSDIAKRAVELVPLLRTAPRREAWLGFRPATESGEPQLTRLSNSNVWLAYGHYRNGILMAPATAARVSAEIVARERASQGAVSPSSEMD